MNVGFVVVLCLAAGIVLVAVFVLGQEWERRRGNVLLRETVRDQIADSLAHTRRPDTQLRPVNLWGVKTKFTLEELQVSRGGLESWKPIAHLEVEWSNLRVEARLHQIDGELAWGPITYLEVMLERLWSTLPEKTIRAREEPADLAATIS